MTRFSRYSYNVHGQWVAPAVRSAHGRSSVGTSLELAKALERIERAYAAAKAPQQ
jgi:hypothetical protein